MDCTVLLQRDRDDLEKLFVSLEGGDVSAVPEICTVLTSHVLIDGDETTHAPAHDRMKALIADLGDATTVDEHYVTTARDLMALGRHHLLGEAEPRERTDAGASSDGDASWAQDPYLNRVVDPAKDRSVEAAMRRSQGEDVPDHD